MYYAPQTQPFYKTNFLSAHESFAFSEKKTTQRAMEILVRFVDVDDLHAEFFCMRSELAKRYKCTERYATTLFKEMIDQKLIEVSTSRFCLTTKKFVRKFILTERSIRIVRKTLMISEGEQKHAVVFPVASDLGPPPSHPDWDDVPIQPNGWFARPDITFEPEKEDNNSFDKMESEAIRAAGPSESACGASSEAAHYSKKRSNKPKKWKNTKRHQAIEFNKNLNARVISEIYLGDRCYSFKKANSLMRRLIDKSTAKTVENFMDEVKKNTRGWEPKDVLNKLLSMEKGLDLAPFRPHNKG